MNHVSPCGLFCSTDLSYFKYDEFITVLDLVNRLMAVGEEFCGSKSEGLQDSIRKQSLNYFKTYHRSGICLAQIAYLWLYDYMIFKHMHVASNEDVSLRAQVYW